MYGNKWTTPNTVNGGTSTFCNSDLVRFRTNDNSAMFWLLDFDLNIILCDCLVHEYEILNTYHCDRSDCNKLYVQLHWPCVAAMFRL